MARQNGRNISLVLGAYTVAVMKTHTITFANNPVDVTGYTDAGFITLLERAGSRQMTFDASGVVDDETLNDYNGDSGTYFFPGAEINYLADDDSGDIIKTLTVDLFMTSYSETGGTDGAREFSASFVSSGAWVKSTPTP